MPEIDLSDAGCVRVGGKRVPLGPVQWGFFRLLVDAKGKCVTREKVLHELYGMVRDPPDSNVLNAHICNLRKKFRGTDVEIAARHGFGWFLK